MKKIAFLILVLSAAATVRAEDSIIQSYAAAPLIDTLYVKIENGLKYGYTKSLETKIPVITNGFPPLDNAKFRYSFEPSKLLNIYYQEFNPLEVAVKLVEKEDSDSIYDKGKFFEFLAGYKELPLGYVTEESGVKAREITVNDCDVLQKSYGALSAAIRALEDSVKDPVKPKDEFETLVKKATSYDGLQKVVAKLKVASENLGAGIGKVRKIMKEIRELGWEGSCSSVPVSLLAQVSYITDVATGVVGQGTAIKSNIDELTRYLEGFDENNWDGHNYRIGTIAGPARGNLKRISISVKGVGAKYSDGKVELKQGDSDAASGTFVVHNNENIIYEPGIAAVWSGLTYYQFSTKTVGGSQVVVKTKNNDPIHVAALLNIYLTKWANESVFPLAQIGLASAKENPAVMCGLGLRIRDTSFSIAGGAIVGFIKELKNLNEGSTVSGQADIDNNEKVVAHSSWYLAVQYGF